VFVRAPSPALVMSDAQREILESLAKSQTRRGVFKSVPDLIAAIEAYLQANNNDPKPFVWTATAEEILHCVEELRARVNEAAATSRTEKVSA